MQVSFTRAFLHPDLVWRTFNLSVNSRHAFCSFQYWIAIGAMSKPPLSDLKLVCLSHDLAVYRLFQLIQMRQSCQHDLFISLLDFAR